MGCGCRGYHIQLGLEPGMFLPKVGAFSAIISVTLYSLVTLSITKSTVWTVTLLVLRITFTSLARPSAIQGRLITIYQSVKAVAGHGFASGIQTTPWTVIFVRTASPMSIGPYCTNLFTGTLAIPLPVHTL